MAADVLSGWLEAMYAGDFEAAWQQTDRIEIARRAAEAAGDLQRRAEQLVWNGQPFEGKRVLVRCEHGLGDSIQFLRYTPLLRRRAAAVILKVQPALLPLFEGMLGADEVINAWTTEPDPPHDLAIECMELPYAFRSTIATLPADIPYLPVERIRRSVHRLLPPAGSNTTHIGLIWASSSWDPTRSLQLRQLAALAALEGVQLFSLQQGPEAAEIERLPFEVEPLSARTGGVVEAAAAMLELDAIVTVDSMPAHLAGALGRPVFLLLQHRADWRWMEERSDSPWYPTMRIFRQAEPGDWPSAVEQLAASLRAFVAERRTPNSEQ
jgi:hypothetical protein